jgi:alkylation response protein AidB-like acyl-CoA dehydrogenase
LLAAAGRGRRLAVELDLGPEIAQFRAELRDWIAAEAPPALAGLADWNMPLTAGGRTAARIGEAEAHPAYAEWVATLEARRLICPQWPEEFGGQGMGAVQVAVLNEEFYRAGVPRVTRGMGEWLVAPSVIVHGTAEQQAYFLPRILSGEDTYCQGFSEPGHGSDLAAVETRSVVDGDELVITGQKVWTSGAARATRMFLLCRTDPDVPKHAGLSYVLIDFTGPGVTYRPIRQMSGAAEFYEDFLDGVRAPLFNVIGGLNHGWRVAMTTLGHERGGRATVAHLGFEREFWKLAETARKRGKSTDPLVRQQLGWAYTQVELMRFSGLRTLAQVAAGRPPGPEASVAKLFWSEYHKRLGEIAIGIEGSDGLLRPDGDGYPVSSWQSMFLSSRAGTIYSGTSEIQRNIIGERALGLPKETLAKETLAKETTPKETQPREPGRS